MTGRADGTAAPELTRLLAAELHYLQQRIGVSLDELVAATRKNRLRHPGLQELARSTMDDVVRGRRVHPPSREWLTSFVTACIMIAREKEIDLGEAGSPGYWYQRHSRTLAALADTAPYPVIRPGPDLAGQADHMVAGASACQPGTTADVTGEPVLTASRQVPEIDRVRLEEAMRASLLGFAGRSWWQEYHDIVPDWFAPYLTLEPSAELIRIYESAFVPGLLQTESYAREVIRLCREEASEAELQRRVELRMRRQEALGRPDGPRLWAVIDVHAFSHPALSRTTVQGQVKRLTEISDRPGITIQVTESPADQETVSAPVTLLRFPQSQYPDIAYLEQSDGAIYPRMRDDIDHYHQVFSRLAVGAATPDATTTALRKMLAGD
jgi:Domain of unknown function (DUF5753)